MISSISPVCVNRSYVPNFRGELPPQSTNYEKSEQKSGKSWMLWTGLAALAAGGIYHATRGKAGKEVTDAAISATKQAASGKHIPQTISFNRPEDKKFLGKIQQKIDKEWMLLKELPSGEYVKRGNSYVPATNSDECLIKLIRKSKGCSYDLVEKWDYFKNGKVVHKSIKMDEKGKVIQYQSGNYIVGISNNANGVDIVSCNIPKGAGTLAYSEAILLGEFTFRQRYKKSVNIL